MRVFLWTLLPESKARGSRPADFTHSRWESPCGNSRSSPMSAMALVWAMPLMPVSNWNARSRSGCFPIKASASLLKQAMRFSSWEIASPTSRSTAFGFSFDALSVLGQRVSIDGIRLAVFHQGLGEVVRRLRIDHHEGHTGIMKNDGQVEMIDPGRFQADDNTGQTGQFFG